MTIAYHLCKKGEEDCIEMFLIEAVEGYKEGDMIMMTITEVLSKEEAETIRKRMETESHLIFSDINKFFRQTLPRKI